MIVQLLGGNPQSFLSYMSMLQQQSNNMMMFSYPNAAGGMYLNINGVRVPAPVNVPDRILTEEQANSAKLFCTKGKASYKINLKVSRNFLKTNNFIVAYT